MIVLIDRTEEELVSQLIRPERQVTIVTSINYEDRSLSWLERLAPLVADSKAAGAEFHLIYLYSGRSIDILGRRKDDKYGRAKLLLKDLGARERTHKIHYAGYDEATQRDRIRTAAREIIRGSGGPLDLVIDISALPKTVIFCLLDPIFEAIEAGGGLRVYLLYTHAGDYPRARYDEFAGAAWCFIRDQHLHEVLGQADSCYLVLLPGTQATESNLIWQMSMTKPGKRDTIIYWNAHDITRTLWCMRANQGLLYECTRDEHSQLINAFTMADIEHQVRLAAMRFMDVHNADGRGKAAWLLVAPFGIKPVAAAAYTALRNTQKGLEDSGVKGDIALVKGFQYLSVYSLGVGPGMILEAGATRNAQRARER